MIPFFCFCRSLQLLTPLHESLHANIFYWWKIHQLVDPASQIIQRRPTMEFLKEFCIHVERVIDMHAQFFLTFHYIFIWGIFRDFNPQCPCQFLCYLAYQSRSHKWHEKQVVSKFYGLGRMLHHNVQQIMTNILVFQSVSRSMVQYSHNFCSVSLLFLKHLGHSESMSRMDIILC